MSIIFSLINQPMDISAWFRKLGRADLNILSVERHNYSHLKTTHIYRLTLGHGANPPWPSLWSPSPTYSAHTGAFLRVPLV